MIPRELADALQTLAKLPVPQGEYGEAARVAYRTVRDGVAALAADNAALGLYTGRGVAHRIDEIYTHMPALPVTRDNLNYPRAQDLNTCLEKLALLHLQVWGKGKAALNGEKLKRESAN